jgi:hypothetical protein
MTQEELKSFEGPAFACISATICALAISKLGDNIWLAVVYWVFFALVSGVFINPLDYKSIRQLILYCAMPAGWLVSVWVSLPLLAVAWGGKWSDNLFQSFKIIAPIMFVSSALFITIVALASRRLISLITTDDVEIGKINRRLQAWGALATCIYGGVVWLLNHLHV